MGRPAVRTMLQAWAQALSRGPRSPWRAQFIAFSCVLAATLLRLLLDRFTADFPFITFFPAVAVASLWGGLWAGLTSLILSVFVAGAFLFHSDASTMATPIPLGIALFVLVCLIVIVQASLIQLTLAMHRESEERAQVMAHEMRHRSNNILGVVQAISSQTARNADSLADYQKIFSARLVALARAHELVAQGPGGPPDLRHFLQKVLEPFGSAAFRLRGPDALVPAQIAPSLGLLIHELGTNGMKYGALSVAQGVIDIEWSRVGDRIELRWSERDGPEVQPPSRTGFGSRLLRTAFPPEQGETTIEYKPDGVQCMIAFRCETSPLR